ncbi:hypothetical protein WHR41_08164 [Cladosporium halotolerans]|uniref:Uncharacterized protein n=1 Tax=Cladosporium halotolerans TaxID=1052096 RepID=A0AB34KG77_9PEZI
MAKPKQFARPSKAPKAKAVEPRTPDEYQDAADKEEETGGKWRAGDPAKSGRAFLRALDIYDRGLKKFPANFDLAYNKARLELEVSQSPAIVEKVGLDLQALLRQTLDSHRLALGLDAENVDVRFNASQVMTSLAEVISEDEEGEDEEAVALLHESLEMLEGCLARQEMAIEQQKADFPEDGEEAEEEEGGVPVEGEGKEEAKEEGGEKAEAEAEDEGDGKEEQSAIIMNPVTPNDLLDTVHASLSALTTLIPLVGESALGNLGDMAHAFTDNKAPNYIALMSEDEQDAARLEVGLARASFIAAYADAQYSARLIELQTYVERLQAFDLPNKDADAHALTTEAQARAELVLSAFDQLEDASKFPASDCWKQLSITQDRLTKASKLTTEDAKERKAEIFESKGDAELLRYRLATMSGSTLSESVRNSGLTLLSNAFKFYKGAADHAKVLGDEEIAEKAKGRMAVIHVVAKMTSEQSAGAAGGSSSSSSASGNVSIPGPPPKGVDLMEAMNECMDDGLMDLAGAERVLEGLSK